MAKARGPYLLGFCGLLPTLSVQMVHPIPYNGSHAIHPSKTPIIEPCLAFARRFKSMLVGYGLLQMLEDPELINFMDSDTSLFLLLLILL